MFRSFSVSTGTFRRIYTAENSVFIHLMPTPLATSPLTRRTFLGAGLALVTFPRWSAAIAQAASDKDLKVALIGDTGHGDYGHGLEKPWSSFPGVRLVAVADQNPAGLAKATARLGIPGYADYREMLTTVSPDILIIGPRHIHRHHEMAMAGIQQGVRAIYMEKPFCRNLQEADEIVAACKAKNVKLALAHRNRYHPDVARVKRHLAAGTLGTLKEVSGTGKQDRRAGAEDLWVLGSHVFNLALCFTGKATRCEATVKQDGRPLKASDWKEGGEGIGLLAGNYIDAHFSTESGVPIRFYSAAGPHRREPLFVLRLVGTKGVIQMRFDEFPLAYLETEKGLIPLPLLPGEPLGPSDAELRKDVGDHYACARDLLHALRTDGRPLCNEDDGRDVVEMTFAIFASQKAGKPVSLPLDRTLAYR